MIVKTKTNLYRPHLIQPEYNNPLMIYQNPTGNTDNNDMVKIFFTDF